MEILAELLGVLAICVVVNAVCMAQIMKWQALQMRGWHITRGEAMMLQIRTSVTAVLCVLVALFGVAWLPQLNGSLLLAICVAAYFIPYYMRVRRLAYLLTRAQKDRGRGVARGNIRDIVQASFGYAFLTYAIIGGGFYWIWRMANSE
jgi:hypothetical protein